MVRQVYSKPSPIVIADSRGGYVRLYRRIWGNPVFQRKQEAAMFAWMVSDAQWQDRTLSTQYGPVKLFRGEVLVAERVLSRDFGLHRNTVRKLFRRMVDAQMIEVSRDRANPNVGTVVFIKNYNAYQGVEEERDGLRDHGHQRTETTSGPLLDILGTKNKEGNQGKEWKNLDATHPMSAVGAPSDLFPGAAVVRLPDPVEKAFEAWNAMAAECDLSQAKVLTTARRSALRARLRECGGLDGWLAAISAIPGISWMLGENDRAWKADLDFVLQPKSFTKLREGAYSNRGRGVTAPAQRSKFDGMEKFFVGDDAPAWDIDAVAEMAS